ncbi:MAG: hypothetical protein GY898_06105 [Proteobacteria bacterium]|nr:hypothetical protein [Pseudomonadota bacterium]
MPETTETAAGARPLSDEKIITPHREVRLTSGEHVVVAPWGMTQGSLVMARLEALQPKLAGIGAKGPVTPHALLAEAWDEIVEIVSMTVGVARADMERPPTEGGWTFEDLLAVTDAVLDVCLVRSDGRGALPLLMGLVGRMTELEERATNAASLLSTTSGKRASSPASSGNGSASKRGRRGRGRA